MVYSHARRGGRQEGGKASDSCQTSQVAPSVASAQTVSTVLEQGRQEGVFVELALGLLMEGDGERVHKSETTSIPTSEFESQVSGLPSCLACTPQ